MRPTPAETTIKRAIGATFAFVLLSALLSAALFVGVIVALYLTLGA